MNEVTRIITDKKNLIFVGSDAYEEMYLNIDTNLGGWSFMGLRAHTETELREFRRDIDPSDMGFDIPSHMEKYFDYESFADNMEDDWYNFHDVQAERYNDDGEILYLIFGSDTDYKYYFNENNIYDYVTYIAHFETIGLTEPEFNLLIEGDSEKIIEVFSLITANE